MMTIPYIKAKKSTLVECFTCPLCLNLLREATTICVCLHTFCKDCIYQKFEEDETYCCPICNVYLGCLPKDKLRPDNNLQDLRMKIFPLKKSKEVESTSIAATPTRRKEKSLSSLVTSTPPVSTNSGMGRAKAAPRRGGLSRGTGSKHQPTRDLAEVNCILNQSYSPECSNTSVDSRKQRVADEGRRAPVPGTATGSSPHQEARSQKIGKAPNWERLTFLAETANNTNYSNTATPSLPAVKGETNDKKKKKNVRNLRRRARELIAADQGKEAGKIHQLDTIAEKAKADLNEAIKDPDSEKESVATTSKSGLADQCQGGLRPVWFSLLASKDRNGNTYPQIPIRYIRIEDGSIPISFINKYLVQKLNLKHESEVEVLCCGQTLVSTAPLNSLYDIWMKNTASTDGIISVPKKKGEPNPSGQNFVMVLTYRIK